MIGDQLFSLEAEEKVLGFLFNSFISRDKKLNILQIVDAKHFYLDSHKIIFKAIKLWNIFDKIVLWEKIKDIKENIEFQDLNQIDDFVTEDEIDSYIEILTDKLEKRLVYNFADEIRKAISEGRDQYQVLLKSQEVLTSINSKQRVETNQELLERVLSEQPSDVISTGFKLIDEFIGGYARGMIITIAGDSGHLKTTLAIDKAFRMAEANPKLKIGIFSKEMMAEDLIKKQISHICKIPMPKLFAQDYDKESVRKKMAENEAWNENRIRIINPNSFSGVSDIARIQMTHNFDVWFLDFIQLLEFAKSAATSSDYNVQVGQNMRGLQSLALMTKSVGIVLSQVRKGIEMRKAKKPTVSDIEWSGLIKQLSSYIFFSYYPGKYYGFDAIPADNYFLLGEKTRFAENFVYPIKIDPEFGTFEEIMDINKRQEYTSRLRSIVEN